MKRETAIDQMAKRATTADIDGTINRLENAFSYDQLDEAEFGDRMTKALSAKTKGDLSELVRDLMGLTAEDEMPEPCPTQMKENRLTAIFGGIEQRGPSILPPVYRIKALMAGCSLDLRSVKPCNKESHLHINAIMSGVEIIAPKNVRIVTHGMPIFGGISHKPRHALPDDAPVIHVHCLAIFSGIEITTRD